MKKLLLSLLVALCAVCALFGFAACSENDNNTTPGGNQNTPQTYSITVDCGVGGTYKLSNAGPVAAGTQVTLTVTPQTGYVLSSVTKNGETVNLVNGRHVFTPSEDTSFVITFEKLYSVTVECGANGNYTLTPENLFYRKNAEVKLTLTPNTGYEVDTFTVNGTAVDIKNNEYSFNITADTTISVTFKALVSVTVTCGSGGSYELSPTGGIYSAGTTVTLTLLPNDGYEVQSFTVNGVEKKDALTDNQYEFDVTSNTNIVVRYYLPADENALDVLVTSSGNGSYSLSPDGPYHAGDNVTLTVTPNEGCYVQSVNVDGQDVTAQLTNNTYTIRLTGDVNVEIVFAENLFGPDYIGTWTSIVGAGTLPDEIVIGANSFTFNDTAYTPTKTASGYTFTVTEDEDVYNYSFTLEEVGAGKYLLILTIKMPDLSVTTRTCTKEGVSYSVDFPEELWGDWYTGPSRYPISIDENGLTIEENTAVVHSYNEITKTYSLLAGGIEYTLVWNEAEETLTLTIVGDDSSAAVYTKTVPPDEAFFTELAEKYYTNGAHNVQIGADGTFIFDGRLCHVYPVDSTDIKGYGYTFYIGSKLWHLFSISETEVFISDYTDEIRCYALTGEEAYTVSVTCGDNGSYTLNDPKNGEAYGGYEEVVITIIPESGYRLDKLILDGTDVAWAVTDNVYKFYISKNSTVEISFIADDVDIPVFPDRFYNYIFRTYSSDVTLEFRDKQIILTYNGQVYTANEKDAVLTEGRNTNFTVNFEGLGDVHIVYYGQSTIFTLSWGSNSIDLKREDAKS